MKKILITGANFVNKGAQAMLFVTVSEIRARYPDADIYYTTKENLSISSGFRFTALDKHTFLNAFERKAGKKNIPAFWAEALKQAIRSLLKGNFKAICSECRYLPLIGSLDLIFDVSGYNLSSQFSPKANDYYLKMIGCAQKCGIPIILLPQSFGPFDYGENASTYIRNMRGLLQYPTLIFAREQGGYDLLTKQLGLENVVLSTDMVLQNRGIQWRSVFEAGRLPKRKLEIPSSGNVAIIPNQKIQDKCPHIDLFSLYDGLVAASLQGKKHVYLIYHSSEDYGICKAIKKRFAAEEAVILVPQELNCYDYTNIITHFDYIIASRYHSIVHAFKQEVPCLGLGWADKYLELFESLGQRDYVLDMREDISNADVLLRLKRLENGFVGERAVIEKNLHRIQTVNCFKLAFEELRKQNMLK